MAGAKGHETPASNSEPGRVRLRTLVLIRWIAVAGQAAALLIVDTVLAFPVPLGPAFLVVTASALFNVVVSIRWPATARLGDRAAALTLAYDILQLSALLYLTGGLNNPFAVLILVPATIAATILSLTSTVSLAGLALAAIAVLAVVHLPLPWSGGGLELQGLYLVAVWAALSLGVLFLTAYAWRVAREARMMADALAETQRALAREQRLADLGGLAAAAAHELATPLGTIVVSAKEVAGMLPPESPVRAEVEVLRREAERCREILAGLSRRPELQADGPFTRLPLGALIDAVAAPYRGTGTEFEIAAAGNGPQPEVARAPEVAQGLGNLIANAADFARTRVSLRASWDADSIAVEISDDGPGFALEVLGVLGEPYVSGRREGEGMGLGVFIARTLLARTGAEVSFANRRDGGAQVTVKWPREALGQRVGEDDGSSG